VNLQPGDVIPFDMPDSHILTANDVPMFRARLGTVGDNLALKVLDAIRVK